MQGMTKCGHHSQEQCLNTTMLEGYLEGMVLGAIYMVGMIKHDGWNSQSDVRNNRNEDDGHKMGGEAKTFS